MNNVFEYDSYKDYLRDALRSQKARSGLRARLSKHLNIQTSYLSRVMNGAAQLSSEQAYETTDFLSLDPASSDFFILLVQRERAGSERLENYWTEKIDKIRRERKRLKARVKATSELPKEAMQTYFSSWLYSAVHLAIVLPETSNVATLSRRLHWPQSEVGEVLNFLVQHGILKQKEDKYIDGETSIHLPDDSPYIRAHHRNQRLLALRHIEMRRPKNLNYAATFAISRDVAEKIRNRLMEMIEENMKIINKSDEESVFCSIIDFFEL